MSQVRYSHCPRCKNTLVFEVEGVISCPHCKLTFNKEILSLVEAEDILSNEELSDILDIFREEGDLEYLRE